MPTVTPTTNMNYGTGQWFASPNPAGFGVVVSCIVKADDTSTHAAAVEQASNRGLRLRKTLTDPSQSAASFARTLVEGNKSYIRAICEDSTGGSNCNVILSYGDGYRTIVKIRYDHKMDELVVAKNLMVLIKLVENNMASVVMGKGEKHEERLVLLHVFSIYSQSNSMLRIRLFVSTSPDLFIFSSRDVHLSKFVSLGRCSS